MSLLLALQVKPRSRVWVPKVQSGGATGMVVGTLGDKYPDFGGDWDGPRSMARRAPRVGLPGRGGGGVTRCFACGTDQLCRGPHEHIPPSMGLMDDTVIILPTNAHGCDTGCHDY